MGSFAPARTRLLSLDALRGFDMFWIIGGDAFFRSLAEVTNWGWARSWAVEGKAKEPPVHSAGLVMAG